MASCAPATCPIFERSLRAGQSMISGPPPTSFVGSHGSPYESYAIGSLAPGPIRARFTGVVVNIFGHRIDSKSPEAAKGCLKLLLRDSSGEILVKLWYADMTYTILLGDCMATWTMHISPTASLSTSGYTIASLPASVTTSIFPERDAGCGVHVYPANEKDASYGNNVSTALNSSISANLTGLVELDKFVDQGDDIAPGAKLLVCVVNVGDPVTIKAKSGRTFLNLELGIVDASTSRPTTLSLSEPLHASTSRFTTDQTILLVSSSQVLGPSRRLIKLTPRSQVIVDPCLPEAIRLRHYIQRSSPPCNSVIPPQLSGSTLDKHDRSASRQQVTFRTMLNLIESRPSEIHVGYLSGRVTELNLDDLYKQGRLFCMPCYSCGRALYGNTTSVGCLHCRGKGATALRFNPQILGALADETGGMASAYFKLPINSPDPSVRHFVTKDSARGTEGHNLLVADTAFKSLLNLTPDQLASLAKDCFVDGATAIDGGRAAPILRQLEEVVTWLRVTFVVAWTGDWGGGRFVVLDVLG